MSERMIQAQQVSAWIEQYNQEVGSTEILPKLPAVIASSLEVGGACLIRSGDDEPVAYGAIYPLIDEVVARKLGFLPIELGSMITVKEYRGNGYGRQVAQSLRGLADAMHGSEVVTVPLATIKRPGTIKALGSADIEPVSFFSSPYLAFLTCVCDSGEQQENVCRYRRGPEESDITTLASITLAENFNSNEAVNCTLLAEKKLVERFEARCRELHEQIGGEPVLVGDISVDSFNRIGEFFNQLNQVEVTYE